jgi:hypothetical protein
MQTRFIPNLRLESEWTCSIIENPTIRAKLYLHIWGHLLLLDDAWYGCFTHVGRMVCDPDPDPDLKHTHAYVHALHCRHSPNCHPHQISELKKILFVPILRPCFIGRDSCTPIAKQQRFHILELPLITIHLNFLNESAAEIPRKYRCNENLYHAKLWRSMASLHLECSAHTHTRIWSIGRPSNHAIATWYFRKKLLHIRHLGMSICQHCVDMGAADSAGMTVTGCVSSHFCEIVIIMSFSQHKLQTYITWHGDRCAWLLSRDITRWRGSLYQAAICRRIDYVYLLNDCAKH